MIKKQTHRTEDIQGVREGAAKILSVRAEDAAEVPEDDEIFPVFRDSVDHSHVFDEVVPRPTRWQDKLRLELYAELRLHGRIRNEFRDAAAHRYQRSTRTIMRHAEEARISFVAECVDIDPANVVQARAAQLIRATLNLPEVEQRFADAVRANDSKEADTWDKIIERRMRRRDKLCGLDQLSPLNDLSIVETRRFVIDQLLAQLEQFTPEEIARLEKGLAALHEQQAAEAATADTAEAILDGML